MPLVTNNPAFDQRLFECAGPEYIPHPKDLTPQVLEELLASLQDPAMYVKQVEVSHWKMQWHATLLE